ncbi:MAG: patatin-like phospholipase family protein [Myxococcota bacterium]|nr:patatin-like phospholipase family protein [Myxococcota bacterium]
MMSEKAWKSPRSGAGSDFFESVVFAGGGCRCFWQAGFWSVVSSRLPSPQVVLGVSAGAAFACASLLGRGRNVLEDFKVRVSANERNFYPRRILAGRAAFPHESMYRATIREGLSEGDFDRLKEGPDVRIMLARPPERLPGRSGFFLGGLAYMLDNYEKKIHSRWGYRLGFGHELVSIRDLETRDELVELILHSSCTPPVLPLYRRGGRIVLDGGLVDNAPAGLVPEARSTLVLLTRHQAPEEVPEVEGRTYAWPSRPVPVVKFDYTNPELVQETWDLGCRDGEAFIEGCLADYDLHADAESESSALSA